MHDEGWGLMMVPLDSDMWRSQTGGDGERDGEQGEAVRNAQIDVLKCEERPSIAQRVWQMLQLLSSVVSFQGLGFIVLGFKG